MKKLSVFVAAAVLIAAAGAFNVFGQSAVSGYPRNPKFGNVAVTGSVTSTKACASGYTRKSPSLCIANNVGNNLMTRDACTTVTPDAGATAVIFMFDVVTDANNAIADRWTDISSHLDNTCGVSGQLFVARGHIREMAATAAGTQLMNVVTGLTIQTRSGGSVYLKMDDDAGNQGTAIYRIVGYYD